MYAIVKTGGKQYTVKPGDVLDVEKIEGEAGDKVSLDVLFLNDGSNVVTDASALAKTNVTAEILDQHKGDKQIIFKFKKRKGYKAHARSSPAAHPPLHRRRERHQGCCSGAQEGCHREAGQGREACKGR